MPRSTAASPPRLLTVAQVAEHLGTTHSELYELVARPRSGASASAERSGSPRTSSTDSSAEPARPRPQRTSRPPSARAVSTPETTPRIAAVAMPASVSDRAAPQDADRPPEQPRCPNAATARSTPANAISRTLVRPPSRTQTCTLVRPVGASTRSTLRRRGHEPARAADGARQRRRRDVADLPHPSDPGRPLGRRRAGPPRPQRSPTQRPDRTIGAARHEGARRGGSGACQANTGQEGHTGRTAWPPEAAPD